METIKGLINLSIFQGKYENTFFLRITTFTTLFLLFSSDGRSSMYNAYDHHPHISWLSLLDPADGISYLVQLSNIILQSDSNNIPTSYCILTHSPIAIQDEVKTLKTNSLLLVLFDTRRIRRVSLCLLSPALQIRAFFFSTRRAFIPFSLVPSYLSYSAAFFFYREELWRISRVLFIFFSRLTLIFRSG